LARRLAPVAYPTATPHEMLNDSGLARRGMSVAIYRPDLHRCDAQLAFAARDPKSESV